MVELCVSATFVWVQVLYLFYVYLFRRNIYCFKTNVFSGYNNANNSIISDKAEYFTSNETFPVLNDNPE